MILFFFRIFVPSLIYFKWMGKQHFDWKQLQKTTWYANSKLFSWEFPHLGITVRSKSHLRCGQESKAIKKNGRKVERWHSFRSLLCWLWAVAVRKMSFSLVSYPHCFCCSTGARVYLFVPLPAAYAQHLQLMRIWEEVVLSLSFILFILLILPPLPSGGTGQWKKEFNQIYAFSFMYSCMCLGILQLCLFLLPFH